MTNEISRKSFLQLGMGLAAAAGAVAAPIAATAQPAPAPMPKTPVRTLIKGVDVLTMEVGNKEYHGVDVMIGGDGKIAAIGKGLPAGDALVIEAAGMILMPGFLDGFRHNWQQLNNGLILKTNQSYKSYYTGFNGKVSQAMTPEDYYLAEYLGCIEAIDNGFTSMVDFSQSLRTPEIADAAIRGAKASGIGGFYAYTPFTQRGMLPGPADYKLAEALRDKHFTGSDGMQWGMGMNEPWGRTFAEAKAYFAGARATKPGILCMHAGSYGSGGGANGFAGNNAPRPPGTVREVKDFVEAGMLGPDLHMSHGTALTMDELKLMAAHGVTTSSAVLVEYSYGLDESSNHARARAAGCAASFGFDAPVESTRDTFEMARRAFVCLFHDAETIKIADTYQSDDTLAFLTREGHRSARLGDVAGTVTVGKRADLLLLRTDRFGFPDAGIGTMADRVLNFACAHDIDSVWVQGVARKRDGKMVGVDWKSLKRQATAATERLYAAVGSPVLGLMKTS
jgi:cytosine/adenosine deaminase-related metal-dependent hydrolase